MLTVDFYLARAAESAAAAQAATLGNVRDRNLRAEAAWRDMAERSLRTERQRAQAIADKAAERAAATAAAS